MKHSVRVHVAVDIFYPNKVVQKWKTNWPLPHVNSVFLFLCTEPRRAKAIAKTFPPLPPSPPRPALAPPLPARCRVAHGTSRGGRRGGAGRVAPGLLLLHRRAVETPDPSIPFDVKPEEREEVGGSEVGRRWAAMDLPACGGGRAAAADLAVCGGARATAVAWTGFLLQRGGAGPLPPPRCSPRPPKLRPPRAGRWSPLRTADDTSSGSRGQAG